MIFSGKINLFESLANMFLSSECLNSSYATNTLLDAKLFIYRSHDLQAEALLNIHI